MLNQSFSAENFRRIIDYENRKGVYLEGRFFPLVAKITEDIKKLNSEIREKKKKLGKVEFDEFKKAADEEKDKLTSKKEEELNVELEKVSERIIDKSFKFDLKKNQSLGEKPVYMVEDKPELFFVLKQIQHNFKTLYKVKQASRYAIVNQVKCLLGDGFPKHIVRTDIDDFYENIPHDKLLQKVYEENLLTFLSKKIIRQILEDYKLKSGSKKGVPRGIGLSAYLAELFMRDIDNEIKALPNISYYARYVDDIIAVFIPSSIDISHNLEEIKKIFNRHSLSANASKTKTFNLIQPDSQCTLEYLGYKMILGNARIKVKLTRKKIDKYKKRIDLVLNSYLHFSKVNEKKARKLLVKRLRFLTGNTRLLNNKRNVLVGIYYSNRLLTDVSDLKGIDKYLEHRIEKVIKATSLKLRLKRLKFAEGFERKRYSPFTTAELSEIIKPWKYFS